MGQTGMLLSTILATPSGGSVPKTSQSLQKEKNFLFWVGWDHLAVWHGPEDLQSHLDVEVSLRNLSDPVSLIQSSVGSTAGVPWFAHRRSPFHNKAHTGGRVKLHRAHLRHGLPAVVLPDGVEDTKALWPKAAANLDTWTARLETNLDLQPRGSQNTGGPAKPAGSFLAEWCATQVALLTPQAWQRMPPIKP